MPAIPAQTPTSFRGVSASWRVIARVRKKVKIGAVEFRMVASPASSERTLQASMVQGITLLRQAWNRKRRQLAASIGSVTPRHRMMTRSNSPAIRVRAAIRVTGGIVVTPTLMKL